MYDVAVSVIIPVYNSEGCLDALVERLTGVLDNLGEAYEIVLVNDCSLDGSWRKITELCENYSRLTGISLRKNFGQDSAIMAGLSHSSGESLVVMDDDLQHDPADIPSLLSSLGEGYDVCYAYFNSKNQSLLKNLGSWFNGRVANVIINKPKEIYLSLIKLLSESGG